MDKTAGAPFKATGKGEVNDMFSRLLQKDSPQPLASNASAVLINSAMPVDSPWRTLYLWVHDITTGWQLGLQYGQGSQGRTIYPHNVTQDDITVKGQCVNMYQYDYIVEWCSRSQLSGLNWKSNGGSQIGKPHLTFQLYPYYYNLRSWWLKDNVDKVGSQEYNPWKYDVYVGAIAVSHKRFVNAPEFEMELIVVNDYLQDNVEVSDDIYTNLTKNYIVSNLAPNGIITSSGVKSTGAQGIAGGTDSVSSDASVTRPDNNGYWGIVGSLPSGDTTFGDPFP